MNGLACTSMAGPPSVAALSVLVALATACGDEVPLQIVEGQLDLVSLEETELVVQARDSEGILKAAAPTDASGYFVLFVPPTTLTVTASGRAVHQLGTIRVCAVGPPIEMNTNPAPPDLSQQCFAAREALAGCRSTVEPQCATYEAQVRTCRSGGRISTCAAQQDALDACLQGQGDCRSETMAFEQCREAECADRLARFLDAGCLDGCRSEEEALLEACTPTRSDPVVTEVGCSPSP